MRQRFTGRFFKLGENAVKSISAVLLLLLSLPLHHSSFLYAADWPVFRGNIQRTGFTAEQAYPPLTQAWEYLVGGGIISSPVIFDDTVYFGSRDSNIYALNARTGVMVWQYAAGGLVDAAPAVSSSAVYVPSLDGYLYALDRLTGNLIWKAGLGASSVSSPLLLDGKVFVGTGSPEKKLKVFDAAGGGLLRQYQANQPVDSAPSTDGDNIYFGANDGKIYAFGKNDLSAWLLYQTMGGRYGMNAVAVSSGTIYALPGYDENKLLALNASDGTLLNPLSAPFDDNTSWEQVGSPVVTKDRIYFSGGAADNTLYAMDKQISGQALAYVWPSSPTLGDISGIGILASPAMANEIIYAGTIDGEIVAFNSDGAPVFLNADVYGPDHIYSSPCISNGVIIVATSGGKIIGYTAEKIVAVSSPKKDEILSGTVPVRGYIANPNLTGYTLEYGQGDDPSVWHIIVSSGAVQPVENGLLAGWDVSGYANGLYTLKLTALEDPVSGSDNTALLTVRINAAPSAPSELSAADVTNDSGNRLRLIWTASPSAGVSSYRIYRSTVGASRLIGEAGSGVLTYIDTAAVTGISFTYAVRAYDGYIESIDSNLASAASINNSGDNTPPSKINDLAAVLGALPGFIRLSWTAPGNDDGLGAAAQYVIRCSSISAYDCGNFDGADLLSYTRDVKGPAGDNAIEELGGLFGGVTYYCAVKTADFVPNLSQLSNITTAWAAIDLVPPLPPPGLTAADTLGDDGGSLTLNWELSPDDGAGDIYGYKLYRRRQNAAYTPDTPYATLSRGTNSYIDNAADTNVRFHYSLAAFDSNNNSQLSNEASAVSADNWRFFDASQGGSIRLPDGAKVDIPENSASQSDNIMVSKLDPRTYQPLFKVRANTQVNSTGIVYEIKFKKTATKLLKPAVLTLPYTDAAVAGMNRENLRIYTLSGGVWLLVNTSMVDMQANKVSAEVSHFSVYAIMEYVPSGDLLNKDEVYTYPNPAKGSSLTFKFKPADKAYVKIDVYNIAGEKMARFEKQDCPAGLTSEIVWDMENIASGVYQYKVEAVSASGDKTIIKRLAIIH